MKRITYAVIIILVILLGCQKDYSIESIDSDIEIKLWETLDSTNRKLQLYCSTQRIYNCSNYGIKNKFSKSSGNIDINFTGILLPDMCLTAFGPARTIIDLGALSNGTYNLNIKVERKKSVGQLIITSDSYSIRLFKQNHIKIINTPLHRIPSNTIWGTVGYHTSSTSTLVQSFIDSLQFLGATAKIYPSGDYGYFEINSNGQILPPENHGNHFIEPFIFDFSGNTSDLKNLVKNYGINYGGSLSIRLYTTKGEIFRSWMQ
jgi:hypothetical protein